MTRTYHIRSLLLSGALVVILASPINTYAQQPSATSREATDQKTTTVRLYVDQEVLFQNGDVGFVLAVVGWKPRGNFSFHAVGPGGEVIPIVPIKASRMVSATGETKLSIPYGLRGLYPGLWQFVFAGDSGIHNVNIPIPNNSP